MMTKTQSSWTRCFRSFTVLYESDLTFPSRTSEGQVKVAWCWLLPCAYHPICSCRNQTRDWSSYFDENLYVLLHLSLMFCSVIPCTSLPSYVVRLKHTVIEALPDPHICRTLCHIHDSWLFQGILELITKLITHKHAHTAHSYTFHKILPCRSFSTDYGLGTNW